MIANPDLARLYVEFTYPEARDLAKHFLTLSSGMLVFSVTFSEKIVGYPTSGRWARRFLLTCWSLLAGSLIACGWGLTYVFSAGWGATFAPENADWLRSDRLAGYWIFAAGGLFVLGLLCLILSAVFRSDEQQ